MCFNLFLESCSNRNVFYCGLVWIGGMDVVEENNFVWINSNEKVEFQRWVLYKLDKVDEYKDCI